MILLIVISFLKFASSTNAGRACVSQWINVAEKQGWIVHGTDGQPVAYCTVRQPNNIEVDKMSQDCNSGYDNKDYLNSWVKEQSERDCNKLKMEVKKSPDGYLLAYPAPIPPPTPNQRSVEATPIPATKQPLVIAQQDFWTSLRLFFQRFLSTLYTR